MRARKRGVIVFRLIVASLVTFGLLLGMVVGVILAAMVSTGEVNLGVAIALTVVINLVIWLISPWLSDVTCRSSTRSTRRRSAPIAVTRRVRVPASAWRR